MKQLTTCANVNQSKTLENYQAEKPFIRDVNLVRSLKNNIKPYHTPFNVLTVVLLFVVCVTNF
jgi:hypothetical protein